MNQLRLALALFFVILLLAASAGANTIGIAGGCDQPLPLPADKILRISPTWVEFEYHGFLPIGADVEVYQHWEDQALKVPLGAVKVGFEEVVATILQGEVVRFDVYDPLYIRTMRVAISTAQFQTIEHKTLVFSPTSKLYVEETGTGRGFQTPADHEVAVSVRDGRLYAVDGEGHEWEFGQRLYVWADPEGLIQINSFQRGGGTPFYPRYRGRFELTVGDGEYFLAINEVSLEEYLYQVVPSEMPISWPLEALKAQAVAARTYAVAQAVYSRQGHLGFHVADSTDSQVYNNYPEAHSTTEAIDQTAGQILVQSDGTIGSTYFYSTSPGTAVLDPAAWKDRTGLALEGNSPWFRWKCAFTVQELEGLFRLDGVSDLYVEARDGIGRVTSLAVEGRGGTQVIQGELNIRRALRPASLERVGDQIGPQSLLPSALFFLELERDQGGRLQRVTVYGGGSGHNLGMSQWGAKGMAEKGHDFLDILSKYYPEAHLITHSEQLRY